MNKLTYEKIVLVVVAVVFAVSIWAYILLFGAINTVTEEIDTVQEEYAQVKANEQAQGAREALVLRTKQDRDELNSYVLSLDNPTPVLALVEQLGIDAGVMVEVESVATEKASTKQGGGVENDVESLQMALSVSGGWDEVYHLLRLLEELPYVAQVDAVALEEVLVEGSHLWKGQVHLRVFVY